MSVYFLDVLTPIPATLSITAIKKGIYIVFIVECGKQLQVMVLCLFNSYFMLAGKPLTVKSAPKTFYTNGIWFTFLKYFLDPYSIITISGFHFFLKSSHQLSNEFDG